MIPNRLTIIEALTHPQIFGALPAFQNLESWSAWLVFLKASYGLPLADATELAIFTKHTGRSVYAPPSGGFAEVVCITGRQSGKTRIAGLIADYEAVTAQPEADKTETYALLLAQDQRSAIRALFGYAKSPFEVVPSLQSEVFSITADTIKLANGVNVCAYPCRPAAVRGLRARVVICDELGFFTSTENIPTDLEMLRAVRPTLATTGGKLIVLSSPYGQHGALWDLHRNNFGRDDAPVLVWQASAPEMNPTLSKNYLERMEQDDPESFRAEVLGQFRSGVSTLLDIEAIKACVAIGVRERAPQADVSYRSFTDPSGGRHDRFAVAVAHVEGTRVVLDAVRSWYPPFSPATVIVEACTFLKTYRLTSTTGDRYSAEFCAEQFKLNGIVFEPSERNRSEIYLELLPLVNSERAVLLDHPELLRELRGLERRRGSGGKDKVDHRGAGSRDDVANASSGALVLAQAPQRTPGVYVFD